MIVITVIIGIVISEIEAYNSPKLGTKIYAPIEDISIEAKTMK